MALVNPNFNHYYKYDELTEVLKQYAASYPNLVKMESIGKSYLGKDIWIMKVTNYCNGIDEDKPAFFMDANIHAAEYSTATICLYLIHTLLTKYGEDEKVTRVLDTRAFYLIPRLNPDGSEYVLQDSPRIVRSNVRPYPFVDAREDGLMERDLDGDGRILYMRIPCDEGVWKEHTTCKGLMVRREPDEYGGKYYRILPEGIINNFDGDTINVRSLHGLVTWPRGPWPKEGLDMDFSYPQGWHPDSEQVGTGPYPVSEPEVRCEVDFIINHRNICGSMFFHSFGAMLTRPYDDRPDEEFPGEDLRVYKILGRKGTEITGYPNVRTFPDFVPNPKFALTGTSIQWCYEYLGIFSWLVETWNPIARIDKPNYEKGYFDWFSEHSVEDDVAIFNWAKETLGDDAYIQWYEYYHPQLGKVELGGWNWLSTWANTPEKLLEKEASLFPDWIIWSAMLSPKMEFHEVNVDRISDQLYKVKVIVKNTGWLPSYVTKKALERGVREIIWKIVLPDSASFVDGTEYEEYGQLEGRAYKDALVNPRLDGTLERQKKEWIIRAPAGSEIEVVVSHDRAGKISKKVQLN